MAAAISLFTMISIWAVVRNSEFRMAFATKIVVLLFAARIHNLAFKPIAISYCTSAPIAASTGAVGEASSFLDMAVEQLSRKPSFKAPKPAACAQQIV